MASKLRGEKKLKLDKRQLSIGLRENIQLPRDVMIEIYSYLARKEVARAGAVCKYWHKCSKDPSFGWSSAGAVELQDDPAQYPKLGDVDPPADGAYNFWPEGGPHPVIQQYRSAVAPGKAVAVRFSKVVEVRAGWGGGTQQKHIYEVLDAGKKVAAFTQWVHHIHSYGARTNAAPSRIRPPLEAALTHPHLWRYRVTVQEHPMRLFTVNLEVNVRQLEKCLLAKEVVPGVEWLVQRISDELPSRYNLHNLKFNYSLVHVPLKNPPSDVQPAGFAATIKLHSYQRAAVAWMKITEEDRDKPFEYCPLVPWHQGMSDALFDLPSAAAISPEFAADHIRKAYARGGILADEMGLGKTIELLGLMLANPGPPLPEDSSLTPKSLVPARATLVLCPNHLAQQWVDEVSKHSSPSLKVILLATIVQMRRYSFLELAEADVVVVTYNLLANQNYTGLGSRPSASDVHDNFKDRRAILKRLEGGWRNADTGKASATGHPWLEQFAWHRIITDEGHESLKDPFLAETIVSLETRYAWYVTGTPVPSPSLLLPIARFLLEDPPHEELTRHQLSKAGGEQQLSDLAQSSRSGAVRVYVNHLHADIILNNLFWRNTKESAKGDWSIPPYKQQLVLLDFTPVELALYAHAEFQGGDRARRLCCDLQHVEEHVYYGRMGRQVQTPRLSLDQIRVSKIAAFRDKKAGVENRIAHDKRDLARITELGDRATQMDRDRLRQIESQQARFSQELAHYTRILKMFLAITPTDPANDPAIRYPDEDVDEAEAAKAERARIAREKAEREQAERLRVEQEARDKAAKEQEPKEQAARDAVEAATGAASKKRSSPVAAQEEPAAPSTRRRSGRAGARASAAVISKVVAAEVEELEEEKPKKARKGKRSAADVQSVSEVHQAVAAAPSDEELALLVQQYGTKLANLIVWLKRLFASSKAARAILFSQYTDFLERVGDILEANDVPVAFVEGNVFKKTKALKKFKDDDSEVKVIMLSLSKAAAGTNLMEASHVVLLDPMVGSKKEALAYEAQAIGRAYRQGQKSEVTVVRFVVRKTVEHETYLRNNTEDEGEQARTKLAGQRSQMVRTNSVGIAIAASSLQRTGSVISMLEQ